MGLKLYHRIISGIIISICALLSVIYGYTSFATITKQLGFYGSLYMYYNVDRIFFGVYNLIVAVSSLYIVILQVKCLVKNNKTVFIRGVRVFIGLVLILIIAEIYLQSRFHGEG